MKLITSISFILLANIPYTTLAEESMYTLEQLSQMVNNRQYPPVRQISKKVDPSTGMHCADFSSQLVDIENTAEPRRAITEQWKENGALLTRFWSVNEMLLLDCDIASGRQIIQINKYYTEQLVPDALTPSINNHSENTMEMGQVGNATLEKNEHKIRFQCETTKHRILIDSASNKSYRYRSWNKPRTIDEKPDVEITDPKAFKPQGTGVCSYTVWDFSRGNVQYFVDEGSPCGEAPLPGTPEDHGSIHVYINNVEKLNLSCQ